MKQTESEQATPRPWRVQGWETYDGDGNAGTFILGGGVEGSASEHLVGAALPQPSLRNRDECDANAALIVEAVNSYDHLRNENKVLREALESITKDQHLDTCSLLLAELDCDCHVSTARAALKEAE